MKQFANPIFSFVKGWLAKGAAQKNINLSYGSPPGEEQEVGRVEEEIVIEPVIGVQDEAVVERVCRFI